MGPSEVIEINSYIVIQRKGYLKLHQLVKNSSVMIGKDKVDLSIVVGKPYWTMFKMVPRLGMRREFDLEECSKFENVSSIMNAVSCGTDNRNITDDGSSQSLSSEEINGLRESGISGQEILEKIVENSKTFKEKTGYSQEKYLKKKEKKYFEYIIIRKPSLRLLADIFYSRDQLKIMGLRHDTLSQILTAANIRHNGVYALFENGSQALVGAGILSYLSDEGLLVNLTVGTNPQKQAVLAMNFKEEQLKQMVHVKIKDFLCSLCPKSSTATSVEVLCKQTESVPEEKGNGVNTLDKISTTSDTSQFDTVSDVDKDLTVLSDGNTIDTIESNAPQESSENGSTTSKRKLSLDYNQCAKKPRWAMDFERATDAFMNRKLNGIIIVAREYPLNIITKLLPFLNPSCQLVVYCNFQEALVQLYTELKKRKDVIGIHLTENWLRMYQVLPDRSHPDVNMSFSGQLLVATKVL